MMKKNAVYYGLLVLAFGCLGVLMFYGIIHSVLLWSWSDLILIYKALHWVVLTGLIVLAALHFIGFTALSLYFIYLSCKFYRNMEQSFHDTLDDPFE